MVQRVLTGLALFAAFIPVLLLSHTPLFIVIAAICSAMAAYEMLTCTGQIKKYFISVPAIIYAALGPLLSRTRFATAYGVLLSITIVFLFYLLYIHVFLPDKAKTVDIAVVFMTSVYITISFTSIVRVRDIADMGLYLFLLIFIGACATDIFAYFGGRFFGRHKLCPKISPKKTIEGALVGTIACTLCFILYFFVLTHFTEMRPNYIMIAFIGAFISVISQLGDLAASAIKRDYGIKDYGNLFPGHGGILDRFDSILAVAPFLFILTGNPEFFNVFNQVL